MPSGLMAKESGTPSPRRRVSTTHHVPRTLRPCRRRRWAQRSRKALKEFRRKRQKFYFTNWCELLQRIVRSPLREARMALYKSTPVMYQPSQLPQSRPGTTFARARCRRVSPVSINGTDAIQSRDTADAPASRVATLVDFCLRPRTNHRRPISRRMSRIRTTSPRPPLG
jgi:hypothetical protein